MGIWFPPTTVLLTILYFCSIVYVSISSFVSVMYGYELWLKIKSTWEYVVLQRAFEFRG